MSVSISQSAANRIAEILAAEGPDAKLRLSVNGGGCSGFSYVFDIDSEVRGDDLVVSRDGATVLVDELSLPFLEGAEIDFVNELIGAAFKVHNPNATANCGCGTSFSI